MYELVRGPLVWIAFIVFVGGGLYKLVSTLALLARKDKVVYPYLRAPSYGLRSLLHWVVPFGSRNMRLHPSSRWSRSPSTSACWLTPLFADGARRALAGVLGRELVEPARAGSPTS